MPSKSTARNLYIHESILERIGGTPLIRLRNLVPPGSVRIVAVEPAESAVLSGGTSGSHRIEGIGAGFVVPLWKPGVVDAIVPVSTAGAKAMARRLAGAEGLFAGTSTGANLIAALKLAASLGPDATIVTVLCDSGIKYYLSTDVYKAA